MSTLDQLAIKYGTDKSSLIHNYCVKYQKYLPFNQEDPIKLLEIGVLDGNSLLTWSEYFPNSSIIGIDINPECKQYEKDNIIVEIGSQVDEEFLKEVIEKHGPFDMILDDGSHFQSHMIKSFEILFPYVKNQGIYIVEDTCCAYWPEYEGGLNSPNTSVEYFKKLIDDVNFQGKYSSLSYSVARREDYLIPSIKNSDSNIRIDIESINFLNSIILINKR
jgi:hypothetical protein